MARYCLFALLLIFQIGFSQQWEKNYAEALQKSKEEGKNLLLVFSGSDWCGPCIRLNRAVWQTKAFNSYASDKLVLYKADFPKRKKNQLPENILNANKALAEKYGLHSFPMVVLLDENETVKGQLVNLKMTPKSYISKIEDLLR